MKSIKNCAKAKLSKIIFLRNFLRSRFGELDLQTSLNESQAIITDKYRDISQELCDESRLKESWERGNSQIANFNLKTGSEQFLKIFAITILALAASCSQFQDNKPIIKDDEIQLISRSEENRMIQQNNQTQSQNTTSSDSSLQAKQISEKFDKNLSENQTNPVKNNQNFPSNQNLGVQNLAIIPSKPENQNLKTEIALLIPVSGQNKELGEALFNAATMSLFENDRESRVKLVLFDSKEASKSMQQAFKMIIERKIRYVIGPVFSSLIPAIDEMAREQAITVISLSNNFEMLNKVDKNGGVFLGGILPETQIERIVNFAASQNKKNFAIIAPNNSYGRVITSYFKASVRKNDANFITSEFYGNSEKDIERAVEHSINSFAVSDKTTFSKKSISESDRSYVDVIMIPESGKILSKIAASIAKQNHNKRIIQIIGTNQWDEPEIFNDSNLIGAWFPAPKSNRFRDFEKRYYSNFGKIPPRVSSIAYDTINAVISVLRKNQFRQKNTENAKDFIEFNESGQEGFAGIDGRFLFLKSGEISRNLSILRVGNGNFEEIDSED